MYCYLIAHVFFFQLSQHIISIFIDELRYQNNAADLVDRIQTIYFLKNLLCVESVLRS